MSTNLTYDETHELGDGAYGCVYRGEWYGRTPEGEPCAVKKIVKRTGKEKREFEALTNIRHEYVVHYLGYEELGSSCYIVMELCECSLKQGVGSLQDPIEACRQLTEALCVVHSTRHVHRWVGIG